MNPAIQEWLFDPTVGRLAALLVGLILVIVLSRFVRSALGRRIRDSDTRYRVRKAVSLASYLVGALVVVTVFSDRLGGLTVAFGVAGAGIAFALQEVIASVAGWFAISFGGFYRTGDRVQLGGIKGDVIDIGVLRTTLMEVGEWVKGDLYNGRIVRIANSFVFKEPVFNYSGDFPFLWDEITLPMKYGTDWKEARRMLTAVAQEVVGEFTAGAADSWKEITRTFLVEDADGRRRWSAWSPTTTGSSSRCATWSTSSARRRTKDRLFTRILEEIDASGGRVAIASATFHLVESAGARRALKGPDDTLAGTRVRRHPVPAVRGPARSPALRGPSCHHQPGARRGRGHGLRTAATRCHHPSPVGIRDRRALPVRRARSGHGRPAEQRDRPRAASRGQDRDAGGGGLRAGSGAAPRRARRAAGGARAPHTVDGIHPRCARDARDGAAREVVDQIEGDRHGAARAARPLRDLAVHHRGQAGHLHGRARGDDRSCSHWCFASSLAWWCRMHRARSSRSC